MKLGELKIHSVPPSLQSNNDGYDYDFGLQNSENVERALDALNAADVDFRHSTENAFKSMGVMHFAFRTISECNTALAMVETVIDKLKEPEYWDEAVYSVGDMVGIVIFALDKNVYLTNTNDMKLIAGPIKVAKQPTENNLKAIAGEIKSYLDSRPKLPAVERLKKIKVVFILHVEDLK